METAWKSHTLEVAYTVFGWTACFAWSCSFYPQVFLNFSRKSVVGLNFNYVLLNLTKHGLYLIYNATLYFSSAVQFQYQKKYGFDQMIPVAANDFAMSAHAFLMMSLLLIQIATYERGNQTFSKVAIGIVSTVWLCVIVSFFIAFPSHSWLWLISIYNYMQVCMTAIKYTPQAFMNFRRKSTDGFSIGYVLLDFSGGVTSYTQMVMQSIDQNSWVNFYGNIGKVLLSLVSISFDLIFMCQHYVLYPSRTEKPLLPPKLNKEITEPLIKSHEQPVLVENA